MMRIILDTNIILSSISRKSPFRGILDALWADRFTLFVTTEILLEYEEQLSKHFDEIVAQNFISALLMRENVCKIDVYFDLNLITQDPDDNKFANCAFAANAHYLVSNDKHFNVLKNLSFPKINVIKIDNFADLLGI